MKKTMALHGLAILTLTSVLIACGSGDTTNSASLAKPTSGSTMDGSISSLGADGWASVGSNNLGGTGTTGGDGAAVSKIYTVTNRNELLQALYGNTVTIRANGTITGGTLDTSRKIIYVSGTISLNMNAALTELTADDYLGRNNCLTTLQTSFPSITNTTALYSQYYTTYAPNTWNTTLVNGKPPALTGPLETARACAANEQKKVMQITIPSNTSLIGVGSTGKLIHGSLAIKNGSDNIVIRNLAFQDAFDFFPAWDPTDSFPTVPSTPDASGCSTSTPTKCVGGRWNSAYDLISVTGATHIWIDHCELSDGTNHDTLYPPVPSWDFGGNPEIADQKIQHHDGLIDLTDGTHEITISYTYLHDHDKTGLVGNTDSASLTENPLVYGVTYHHNFYQNLRQRQPRVRFGRVHVYNNYYSGQLANADDTGPDYPWLVAWTAGTASKLYIENNVVELAASPLGDRTPRVSNLAVASSTVSNYTKCTNVSNKPWTNADCGTYFYDSGNLFNGSVVDVYAGANFGSLGGTNQPISNEKTATTKYWEPSNMYSYMPDSAITVKDTVTANAGVGKL